MTDLKTKIMRRVYGIWFVKKILPYLVIEAAGFAVFMYLIGQEVYVANVIQYASSVLAANMAHPLIFISFVFDLFLRTRLGVQVSALGSLLMAAFLFRGLVISMIQLALTKSETKIRSASF